MTIRTANVNIRNQHRPPPGWMRVSRTDEMRGYEKLNDPGGREVISLASHCIY
jgi:hypothetical protein